LKECCLRLGILDKQLPDLSFGILNNLVGFFLSAGGRKSNSNSKLAG
jgi:hypothetical protein